MSTRSIARRQTPKTAAAGPRRSVEQRIWTLLALRDQLAATVAAYDAHGIDGATELIYEQWAVEGAIRDLAPAVYEDRWTDWLQHDGSLDRDPGHPHPRCHICTLTGVAAA